ncbi:virulence RhuM family protein [Candidatus Peregrinibacteria bacterium]|nr:virulence RhuM family protein [Candidatus Peregrinibacteria bacterium]
MNKSLSEIILYRAKDGTAQIEVKLEDETVWLTQKQMAGLFDVTVPNINIHLKNIFSSGELNSSAVIKEFLITADDGKIYGTQHYNLDVIISIGYRVNSIKGTQFRIWATQRLKEYIIKGFTMDDDRLANGGVKKGYFDEWAERVRQIRTSEKNFYLKVRNIFTTSADYDPKTDYAQRFFATIQNKFHYAITGLTAAELIAARADARKENMGLTNWDGSVITRDQAQIAKNYLESLELKRLMLLVEQFLSFAELQAVERRVMCMKDWVAKLDGFLVLNEKKILLDSGKVSHDAMESKVRRELKKFNAST